MANPFVKGWRYMMALFGAKIDEYADPKVQIQQAIEDAQRQHQALVQQAAAVIGNQRQLEMKLARQMDDVEKKILALEDAVPQNKFTWRPAPGVRSIEAGSGVPETRQGYSQINVDGQQTTFLMAATEAQQPKYSKDAIAEFELVSNRFDATQGRSAGFDWTRSSSTSSTDRIRRCRTRNPSGL